MNIQERVRTTVSLHEPDRVPVGLLVLAAAYQEFAGISGEDYFGNKEKMLAAQLAFHRRFPEAIPIGGIRPDYGVSVMASGFGFKLSWLVSGPSLDLSSRSTEDIEPVDPYRDGLMPRVLEEMVYFVQHTDDEFKASHGNMLWAPMTLGPLQSIAELVGYKQMYSRIRRDPQWMHRMCEVQTQSAIAWVKAQESALREAGVAAGRFFLADETVGMVSEEHLREFFLPYVQRIYAASQAELKSFHADEDVTHIPNILLSMGANIYNFNFSPVGRLKRAIGHHMCLEGNLDSVAVLANGTPAQIEEGVRNIIMEAGAGGGLIVSTGGGLSTGTAPEKIDVMIEAVKKFGRYPLPAEAKVYPMARPAEKRPAGAQQPAAPAAGSMDELAELVASGRIEDVLPAVARLLEAGTEPRQILVEGLNEGLQKVARLYYQKRSFMPELVVASACFQEGLSVLEPHLTSDQDRGAIIIGAIYGNVQESGILLVGAMLRGAGFRVHNLGANVPNERFIEETIAQGSSVLAVGVYTRERIPVFQDLVRMAKDRGLKVLVGGKGIKKEQAAEAGADAYAENGYEAIERAAELMGARST